MGSVTHAGSPTQTPHYISGDSSQLHISRRAFSLGPAPFPARACVCRSSARLISPLHCSRRSLAISAVLRTVLHLRANGLSAGSLVWTARSVASGRCMEVSTAGGPPANILCVILSTSFFSTIGTRNGLVLSVRLGI